MFGMGIVNNNPVPISFSFGQEAMMSKKDNSGNVSRPKEFMSLDPLYDVIEIMGDHISRVYEYREKTDRGGRFKQTFQDRLIVEAIAEFLMTGKFQLRCPFNQMRTIRAGKVE
jgi:hypothetical protein